MTTPHTTTTQDLEDRHAALTAALEAIDTLRGDLEAAGLTSDDHFRAYHLAEIEGQDGGWLGGPFLVDAIHAALDDVENQMVVPLDRCPVCMVNFDDPPTDDCPTPEDHVRRECAICGGVDTVEYVDANGATDWMCVACAASYNIHAAEIARRAGVTGPIPPTYRPVTS